MTRETLCFLLERISTHKINRNLKNADFNKREFGEAVRSSDVKAEQKTGGGIAAFIVNW